MDKKKLTDEEINNLSPRAREAYMKDNVAIEIDEDDDFNAMEEEE
jgi:hypothetical protein|tara:strand:+ start:750 stop:884 length:135 start_codon:yes stop_codon:yes gene_type:complete